MVVFKQACYVTESPPLAPGQRRGRAARASCRGEGRAGRGPCRDGGSRLPASPAQAGAPLELCAEDPHTRSLVTPDKRPSACLRAQGLCFYQFFRKTGGSPACDANTRNTRRKQVAAATERLPAFFSAVTAPYARARCQRPSNGGKWGPWVVGAPLCPPGASPMGSCTPVPPQLPRPPQTPLQSHCPWGRTRRPLCSRDESPALPW